jgi:hypothetical protein
MDEEGGKVRRERERRSSGLIKLNHTIYPIPSRKIGS